MLTLIEQLAGVTLVVLLAAPPADSDSNCKVGMTKHFSIAPTTLGDEGEALQVEG